MQVIYTDYLIIAGPHKYEVDQVIQDNQNAKLNITIEGDLQYFLLVKIDGSQDV